MPAVHGSTLEPVPLAPQVLAVIAKKAVELKATPKQQAFAQLVVGSLPFAEAYRRAYEAEDCSNTTIWNKASTNAANGKVAALIEAGKTKQAILGAERGAAIRNLLDTGFERGLQHALDTGDYELFNKLSTNAGKQRHIQAYAPLAPDQGALEATNLATAISGLISELQAAGIKDISINRLEQSHGNTQVVDSTESCCSCACHSPAIGLAWDGTD